jgi:hypothetical protein
VRLGSEQDPLPFLHSLSTFVLHVVQRHVWYADRVFVEESTWAFERAGETLEIRRRDVPEGVLLVVTGDGAPRSYFFRDLATLVPFQTDMESFLVSTGWTFVAFTPDRRSGRERRTFPRITERRRWWSDGQPKAPAGVTKSRQPTE